MISVRKMVEVNEIEIADGPAPGDNPKEFDPHITTQLPHDYQHVDLLAVALVVFQELYPQPRSDRLAQASSTSTNIIQISYSHRTGRPLDS